MIIYLDLDETTVDLCTKWAYYYNNRYPGMDYTRDTVPYGNCDSGTEESNRWMDILRIPGFMSDLPFIDSHAQGALRELSHKHRIIPVTRAAAWVSSADKYQWIHTHLRIPGIVKSMRDVMITGAKDRLDPTDAVLIDDDPVHLNEFRRLTIVYARPWNKGVSTNFRVSSWQGIPFVFSWIEDGQEARL